MCERPERFIGLAMENGAALYDIEKRAKDSFTARVRQRDLRTLEALAAEYGARLFCSAPTGLPKAFAFIKMRPALILSVLAAAAALILLSKRVLIIRIQNAGAAETAAIEALLDSEGIRVGTAAKTVDAAGLTEKLEQLFPAEHVEANVDGVVLNIEPRPRSAPETAGDDRPASIYADKDCVIVSIAALDGKQLARAGDAVKRGQLLVSGETGDENSQVRVHAEAEILGETASVFSVNVRRRARVPAESGRFERLTRLSFLGIELDSATAFTDRTAVIERCLLLDGAPVPVFVCFGTGRETVIREGERSPEEMLIEGEERLSRMINASLPKDARLTEKLTDIVWNADGSLTMTATVRAIERIGITRYI